MEKLFNNEISLDNTSIHVFCLNRVKFYLKKKGPPFFTDNSNKSFDIHETSVFSEELVQMRILIVQLI